mgnify:CR=1 FL=1
MKYAYTLRTTILGECELRLTDFVGAREIYASPEQAMAHAQDFLLEVVSEKLEAMEFIPLPKQQAEVPLGIELSHSLQLKIVNHNLMLERTGEIQDPI